MILRLDRTESKRDMTCTMECLIVSGHFLSLKLKPSTRIYWTASSSSLVKQKAMLKQSKSMRAGAMKDTEKFKYRSGSRF